VGSCRSLFSHNQPPHLALLSCIDSSHLLLRRRTCHILKLEGEGKGGSGTRRLRPWLVRTLRLVGNGCIWPIVSTSRLIYDQFHSDIARFGPLLLPDWRPLVTSSCFRTHSTLHQQHHRLPVGKIHPPSLVLPPFIRLGAQLAIDAVSWLSITAQAKMYKVSQGTVVPNDLHTWPADGNESLPFYSGIPCCYPVPAAYHLDGYAFCYMLDIPAMIASSDGCCADIFASTVLFRFPRAASLVMCTSLVLRRHMSTLQGTPCEAHHLTSNCVPMT
jgi:hypothetical protein